LFRCQTLSETRGRAGLRWQGPCLQYVYWFCEHRAKYVYYFPQGHNLILQRVTFTVNKVKTAHINKRHKSILDRDSDLDTRGEVQKMTFRLKRSDKVMKKSEDDGRTSR